MSDTQRLTREQVYEMLTKEDRYAQGWGKGGRKKDAYVSASTGQPFGLMDWIVFAEKYLDEAKLAYANYTPDQGAVRIRLIKAASLLVSALTVHGQPEDLERLAGVSSSKFPILHGGLALFDAITNEKGQLDPPRPLAGQLGAIRSEEPVSGSPRIDDAGIVSGYGEQSQGDGFCEGRNEPPGD